MSKVLVVDDDPLSSDLFSAILKHFGYETRSACSGDSALQHLGEARPDLVILDIMMPGMNGVEVLRRIRSDARTADLPVIMYSALNDESWRDKARLAGATDFWVKGDFDFGELEEKMRSYMPAAPACA